MYAIGIDLGTTNTVISVFRNGRKETLMIDGRFDLPSVVSFKKNQPALLGTQQKTVLGLIQIPRLDLRSDLWGIGPKRTRSMGARIPLSILQPIS